MKLICRLWFGSIFSAVVLLQAQSCFALILKVNLAKQVVVAERISEAGVHVLLTVDPDDVVREIDLDSKENGGEPAIRSNLGPHLTVSGNLTLSTVLPE